MALVYYRFHWSYSYLCCGCWIYYQIKEEKRIEISIFEFFFFAWLNQLSATKNGILSSFVTFWFCIKFKVQSKQTEFFGGKQSIKFLCRWNLCQTYHEFAVLLSNPRFNHTFTEKVFDTLNVWIRFGFFIVEPITKINAYVCCVLH